MKHLIFLSLAFLVITFYDVQAQVQNFNIPEADSLVLIKPVDPLAPGQDVIADIPTLDFPEDAKIRVWWPDTKYDYNMPNLIKPKLHLPEVEVLNWKELKGKNLTQ